MVSMFSRHRFEFERESIPAGGVDKKAGSSGMLRLKIRFF